MQSKWCVLAAGMLVLSLLAGCSAVVAANQKESSSEAITDQAAEIVYGKIKEINGNEILLAIGSINQADHPGGPFSQADEAIPDTERPPSAGNGERPSFSEGERPDRGNGEQPAFPEGALPSSSERMPPDSEGSQTPSRNTSKEDGQERTRASRGDGQRTGGNGKPGQNGGRMEQNSFTLTGEEKNYLIPVTAKIVAKQVEGSTELRFTQLAVKNVICLYLDSSGEIFSVELLQ